MSALATIAEGMLSVLAFLLAGVVITLTVVAAGNRRRVQESRDRAQQDPQPSAPFDPYGLVYVDGVSDLVHGPCATMHQPCRHCAPILARGTR